MIFLLTVIREAHPFAYDEYDSKIVRAETGKQARLIANEHVGDEGLIWTDETKVKCERIENEGLAVELLASFNAG